MISLDPSTLLNGTGVDVNSLVTQALAPENGQVQLLQQQQSDLQSNASLLTGINQRSALERWHRSLPRIRGWLLAEKARLDQRQSHAQSVRHWLEAERQVR